jgi:hypothetical protein
MVIGMPRAKPFKVRRLRSLEDAKNARELMVEKLNWGPESQALQEQGRDERISEGALSTWVTG